MIDVILTTNSPGEVSAWVRPMVKAIKREWPDARITVFIPPCTFASGREVPVVESFPEVERVFGPRGYITYATLRRKPRDFHPGQRGFVLFLGGDLGHAVLLGKRLNYPVYAYSERAAGFPEKISKFFIPTEYVRERLVRKGVPTEQIVTVGDLMLDAVVPTRTKEEMLGQVKNNGEPLVNLLPGSRPHEVKETLPFFLKALLKLKKERIFTPIITLAPFITLENVQQFLHKAKGFDWRCIETGFDDLLELQLNGEQFYLYRGNSYNTMQISDLAISLPGTNNVELAAMEVPTLVVLPLNWPELIPLSGVVGMVGQIPVLGGLLKRHIVIPRILPKFPMVSLFNRVAREMIFPELVGVLTPDTVYRRIAEVLDDSLPTIKAKLVSYAKEKQASSRIIEQIRVDLG